GDGEDTHPGRPAAPTEDLGGEPMSDHTAPDGCTSLAESLAEGAAGAASGPERARVLGHLAGCDDRRRDARQLTRGADDALGLAPQHEPPAGFESAVLDRIAAADKPASRPRRRWVRNLVLAAAALVIGLAGAGIVWTSTSDERELAANYSETLDVA